MSLSDVRKGLLETQGIVVILLDNWHHDWIAARFVKEVLGRCTKGTRDGWGYPDKVILLRSGEDEHAARGYKTVLQFGCGECDEYLGVKR